MNTQTISESSSGTPTSSKEKRVITDELREKTKDLRSDVKEIGSLVKDGVKEKIEDLGETASAQYETGKQKAQDALGRFETTVREKPMTALAIAAGAGLVLGFFFRSRN